MIMKKLIYFLMFVLVVSLAYAGSWNGYVKLYGLAAPEGTVVDAYVDGNIRATTTVQKDGYYQIYVECEDKALFKVNGNEVFEGAQKCSSDLNSLDLTARSRLNGEECSIYSGSSTINLGCKGGYCVHGMCMDSPFYCGDGYCDDGEICPADNNACPFAHLCINGCNLLKKKSFVPLGVDIVFFFLILAGLLFFYMKRIVR